MSEQRLGRPTRHRRRSRPTAHGRRRFLRRIVSTGGGLAAASAAGAAVAGPALAGAGDQVLLGQVNEAGSTTTALSSTTRTGPTLYIDNRAARHALRLLPATGAPAHDPGSGAGQIAMDSRGDPQIFGPDGVAKVYTSRWATSTFAVMPARVLDTRELTTGRSRIIAGSEHLDSAGRIRSGRTIVIQLDEYNYRGHAVRANVTVVNTTGGGYLTLWGRGTRPATSSINWWMAGQVLSNTVLTQLGYPAGIPGWFSAVAIYASSPAAVVIDLAAIISDRAFADQPLFPTASATARRDDRRTLIW